MTNKNIGQPRDKRTEQQRANDLAQTKRPHSAEDKTFVTTGPATGISDSRGKDVADKGAVFEDGTVQQ